MSHQRTLAIDRTNYDLKFIRRIKKKPHRNHTELFFFLAGENIQIVS